jgi:hypothetical protein
VSRDRGGAGDDLPARFAGALARRTDPARPEEAASALAGACCEVLGVDGATISAVGRGAWRLPIGVSDDAAAAAERWRFTIGQGPDPVGATGAPGDPDAPLVVDEESLRRTWPLLHEQLRRHTPFRSTVSVPVRLLLPRGAARVGALDLYLRRPRPDAPSPAGSLDLVDPARRVAALVSAELTRTPGDPVDPDGPAPDGTGEPRWMDAPAARRRQRVWMAISMARQVLGLDEADALALLRATAYGRDRTLEGLADDIVRGLVPVRSLQG